MSKRKPLLVFGSHTKTILQEIAERKEKVPLVYFSSNTGSMNYYFIAHLFYLSQVYQIQKANFIIILNDFIRDKGYLGFKHNPEITTSKISDIYNLLHHFGVPQENVVIHRASEAWRQYILFDDNAPVDFVEGSLSLGQKILEIPNENAELHYLKNGSKYEISYLLQKYIDLLISSNYTRIFPNDFDESVDIHATTFYSKPLIESIKDHLTRKKIAPPYIPQVLTFPKLPFFGQNFNIFPEHIAPDTSMTLAETAHAISRYNLPAHHVQLLFENLLNYTNDSFIDYSNGKRIDASLLPSIINHGSQEQKQILAENLYKFLHTVKIVLETNQEKGTMLLNEKTVNAVAGVLKSNSTIDILHLCTGENTVSDIARKLDKHQPNISTNLSKLRKTGLVKYNKENRPIRTFKRIQIDLERQ